MCSGVPPHSQLHPAQILVGLAGGELQLEWPADAEPTLRKIGAACLQHDPAARPSFDRVVCALIKAVERTLNKGLRSGRKPSGAVRGTTSGPAAAAVISSASQPRAAQAAAVGGTRDRGAGSAAAPGPSAGPSLQPAGGGSVDVAPCVARTARSRGDCPEDGDGGRGSLQGDAPSSLLRATFKCVPGATPLAAEAPGQATPKDSREQTQQQDTCGRPEAASCRCPTS